MPRPLVPFPIGISNTALLSDPLTDWSGSGDWVATGDAVLVDCWSDTNQIVLFAEFLGFWGNNPEVEQSPGARSTRLTKNYTGLPANRLVFVRCGVAFYAQDFGAVGKPMGMWVNDVLFTPNVAASGTVTPALGQILGFGVTNGDGELDVAFGVENLTVSCDLHIIFDNVSIELPDVSLERIYYDAAVLYIGGNAISITRDGFAFDPQEEWEDYDFPGKAAPIEGCEEIVRLRPVLRGSFMLTGEYQFLVYRPDGSWSNHATIAGARTYTPADVRAALATSLSLQNVLAVWRRPGDYLVVEFPRAICRKWALGSPDKDEGTIPVEIEARIPTGASLKQVAYRVHTFPTGTEL